jgi:hypothetical protein
MQRRLKAIGNVTWRRNEAAQKRLWRRETAAAALASESAAWQRAHERALALKSEAMARGENSKLVGIYQKIFINGSAYRPVIVMISASSNGSISDIWWRRHGSVING